MGYFYAIMWFAVGLILIFSISKENKVFYFAGGFFMLLGAWWLADCLMPEKGLFEGKWAMALRIITLAALAILSVAFMLERKRNITKSAQEKENSANTEKE